MLISSTEIRPLCMQCNKCVVKRSGYKYYGKLCTGCMHENKHGKRHPFAKHRKYDRPYIVFKKDNCEKYGFIPKHLCQLDVDHIDANKKNNDPSNLQTLCANCHRLKTQQGRDWDKRGIQ